jgi:hypothetical protein
MLNGGKQCRNIDNYRIAIRILHHDFALLRVDRARYARAD